MHLRYSTGETIRSVICKSVPRNRASRFLADAVDCVHATGRTAHRTETVFEIRIQFLCGRRVSTFLLLFQSPLLFRTMNLREVIYACIHLRGVSRLDEVRNGDSGEQRDHDYGQGDANVTSD